MMVSIVTPTLNALSQLKGCVESVHGQGGGISLEHIVQDGGSVDGTQQWLASQDHLTWKSQPDLGMYDALNHGFAVAKGDIFAWINADERYLHNAIAKVVSIFDQNPDVDFVSGNYIVIDENGRPLAARKEVPLRSWYIRNSFLYLHSCAFFFRRALWEKSSGFNTDYRIRGDKEWMLRVLEGGMRSLHVKDFLGLYTLSRNNLSNTALASIESDRIAHAFGISKNKGLRSLVRTCRFMEKCFWGCYGKSLVCYSVLDSNGEQRSIETRVSGRWRLPKELS